MMSNYVVETPDPGKPARIIGYGQLPFTLSIPSRQRSEFILTHPLLKYASVYVHASEVDQYQETFDKNDIHPAALIGHNENTLPKIRNFMLDNLSNPNEFAIQSDDDVTGLRYIFTLEVVDIVGDDMLDRILSGMCTAKEAGSGGFFFAQSPRPQERTSLAPFNLRRWGRSDFFGIIATDMRFDENLLDAEDLDFTLQCIHRFNILWMDNRYFVTCITARGGDLVGGSSAVSTSQTIQDSYKYLEEKWGTAVIRIGEGKERGKGYRISVKIPQKYKDMKEKR